MPITTGTTAVIVAVPEARDLVDRGRQLFDRFEADAREALPLRTHVVPAVLIGFDGERWRTLVDLR